MIQITDKSKCCGCTACVSVCPKRCIEMAGDEEGFLYPKADSAACIGCGLCEQVCPELRKNVERIPALVYAAKNKNEQIRLASSSGGIFTLLAEKVIAKGGVVFGARFDAKWNVVHDYTEAKDGLAAFRGSKYVQSRMGDWSRIPARYQEAVSTCYALGLLNGQKDGTFGGSSSMNRAQGCTVISRLLDYIA